MGLSVWTFVSSGPNGQKKLPMGSIPGLLKMYVWSFVSSSPDGKDEWPMGSFPAFYEMYCQD